MLRTRDIHSYDVAVKKFYLSSHSFGTNLYRQIMAILMGIQMYDSNIQLVCNNNKTSV